MHVRGKAERRPCLHIIIELSPLHGTARALRHSGTDPAPSAADSNTYLRCFNSADDGHNIPFRNPVTRHQRDTHPRKCCGLPLSWLSAPSHHVRGRVYMKQKRRAQEPRNRGTQQLSDPATHCRSNATTLQPTHLQGNTVRLVSHAPGRLLTVQMSGLVDALHIRKAPRNLFLGLQVGWVGS